VDIASSYRPFEHLDAWLHGIVFAMARMTGMFLVMPAFARLGLTGMLQSAAVLAFALPVAPLVVSMVGSQPLTPVVITGLVLKEGFVGMVIGIVLGVPIWAAEAAGSYVDLQRGATSATLFDQSSGGEQGVTATLFALVMTALFFGSGGLTLTLRTVYESYAIWPASSVFPAFSAQTGAFFVGLLDSIATMGFVLVTPIVIMMLLTDIVLGLVSKAAPQINVFVLSLNVKNLVFAILIVLYGAFMLTYMGNDLSTILTVGRDLQNLVPGTAPPP
jgi:type III secretion protein T